MAWVRVGDTAGTDPSLMAVMEHPKADERTINEAFGFVLRLATLSGAHFTDYVVDRGTCFMVGGSRAKDLIEICLFAGMLEPVELDGKTKYKIHDDPAFIHLRLKKEVMWERQRRNDNRDNGLVAPARKRDGDQCRYCGTVVYWPGPTSNRKGTMDHVHPGEAATIDTFVVACTRCNSAKQANVDWIADNPLQQPPKTPLYSQWTAKFLADNGYQVEANLQASDSAAEESSKGNSKRPVVPGVNDHGASEGYRVDPGTVSRSASAGPRAKNPGISGSDASAGHLPTSPAARSQEATPNTPVEKPGGRKPDPEPEGVRVESAMEWGINAHSIPIQSRLDRDSSPPKSSLAGSGRVGTGLVDKGRAGPGMAGTGGHAPGLEGSGLSRRSRKRRR